MRITGIVGRASLTIEIDEFEQVAIGDIESADAKSDQCQEVEPADPTHSGYCDPFVSEGLLLPLGQPSEVSAESLLVREGPMVFGLAIHWVISGRDPIHWFSS